MNIVTRSDGMMLNLSAAVSFMPKGENIVAEFPGDEFYIIYKLSADSLELCNANYRKEFRGWPIT